MLCRHIRGDVFMYVINNHFSPHPQKQPDGKQLRVMKMI